MQNVLRLATGILLIIIAASKFGFLPTAAHTPSMFTPMGYSLISAIVETGYLFPVIGFVSLICGLAFVLNRYVALAAVVYLPVSLNFALFHMAVGFREFSAREILPYIFILLNVYLLWTYRDRYREILRK